MSVDCLQQGVGALCVESMVVARRVTWGQGRIVGVNTRGWSAHTSPLIVVDQQRLRGMHKTRSRGAQNGLDEEEQRTTAMAMEMER